MKTFRTVIITIIYCYIIIMSFLLLKHYYEQKKYLNEEIIIEKDQVYDDFIKEAKNRIKDLYTKSKTEEEKNCVKNIDDLIELSNKYTYPKAKNHLEEINYYGKVLFNNDDYNLLTKTSKIIRVCNITKEEKEKTKDFLNIVLSELYYNTIINFIFNNNLKIKMYGPTISVTENIIDIQINNVFEKKRKTQRYIAIDSQIESINAFLDIIGDRYE